MKKITFHNLLGKVILIGLTYYSHDNELIGQKQYWGTVIEANKKRIRIQQNNGEIFSLPPDLGSTKKAPPGEYRLKSTDEVVVNPDFLTTWIVNEPEESD